MLRIGRQFVEQPQAMLLCDKNDCGSFAFCKFEPARPDADQNQVLAGQLQQFLVECGKLGWALGLDGHICPGHVQEMNQNRNLVQVATAASLRALKN